MLWRYTPCSVGVSVWEAIFMLVVLKIPVVYLGLVVWWAIRAEPDPSGGEDVGVLAPLTPCGWNDWKRRRRGHWGGSRPRRPRPGVRASVQ